MKASGRMTDRSQFAPKANKSNHHGKKRVTVNSRRNHARAASPIAIGSLRPATPCVRGFYSLFNYGIRRCTFVRVPI